jgi:K(+)-stimulated pyrophosphate-energized sodium pump
MNILIKLTCLIGLVIAPILGDHGTVEATPAEVTSTEATAPESNAVLDAAPILEDHVTVEATPAEETTIEVEANTEAPIENAIEAE